MSAAILSRLSYKTKLEIESALLAHGYIGTDVLFINSPLLSFFILRLDNVTAIAFKGTSNLREMLNNLNVWPQPTNQGAIHAGYLYTINSFGPILINLISPDIQSG